MQTKLTLRLDEELIDFGKRWAKQQGKSFSRLVADYLTTLEKLQVESKELPPITRQLVGIAREADEGDYGKHLEDKYL